MIDEAKYIKERIENLHTSSSRYKIFVLVFIAAGVLALLFSIFLNGNNPFIEELPKFGFGVLMSLLGFFFQNEKLKIDNKLTSLKFLLTQVENNAEVQLSAALKKQLIEKAIGEI